MTYRIAALRNSSRMWKTHEHTVISNKCTGKSAAAKAPYRQILPLHTLFCRPMPNNTALRFIEHRLSGQIMPRFTNTPTDRTTFHRASIVEPHQY
ncbi:unnamed protein product [Gongylonema pulchrum]|uniref:Uncharacterized protein n=1 Tax=Gongylonema pulchrum TaxID=637853 RepID=A0A183DSJ4_9BILA|nr:unnamed protein product [Gongylonema pulchrum]